MISFQESDFESDTKRRAGRVVQDLLEACDSDSRQVLLTQLNNPKIGPKTLQRLLRPKLVGTEFASIGAGSIQGWRSNKDYWMGELS
ncbi:MAG: hypothetical protein KJN71_09375 [Acidimicrobiia bacterium]|nr:hypothetical protein [Acidimicrobiia bacterium]